MTKGAKRSKRGPYNERPAMLDDPQWLAREYERSSAAAIARSLGINPQMVVAALKRYDMSLRSRREEQRRRNPELYDLETLERRIEERSVDEVAQRLGVSKVAVHAALSRSGGVPVLLSSRFCKFLRP